ncbi:NADPH:quinone reductase [Gaertneriomyces sp. JEL0708]|nr:NADPH:quinone reductase [Gaertneriomyces sp. JEL0708]
MSSKLPSVQTGIQILQTGDPSVLKLRDGLPVPTVSSSGVLVKNSYAGINYIDTYFRTGLYPTPLPYVPGKEGEGVVVAVGKDVSHVQVGDRVAYLGGSGSYTQYSDVPDIHVSKVPDNIKEGYGAAALLQGLTAITLIDEAGQVKKGDTVLVTAAAGGVGCYLVQLLKRRGATVIGTASSQKKRDLIRSLGADFAIGYANWEENVLGITHGQGVHVVLDSVGKDTFDGALQVVRRKGTLVTYGNASGKVPVFDLYRATPKNVKVCRPQLFAYIAIREEFEMYTSELFEWIGSAEAQVLIHRIYELADAAEAHTDIQSRNTIGKLLLKIPQ